MEGLNFLGLPIGLKGWTTLFYFPRKGFGLKGKILVVRLESRTGGLIRVWSLTTIFWGWKRIWVGAHRKG